MKKIVILAISMAAFLSCNKPTDELDVSKDMEAVKADYLEADYKVNTDEYGNASKEYLDRIKNDGRAHYINFMSRYKSARDVSGAGYDVGVIPSVASCPLSSELVTMFLDCENQGPYGSGYVNSLGGNDYTYSGYSWAVDNLGNSRLYFCKADGRLFSNSGGRWDVLKLGPNNPANWQSVRLLHLDNEDDTDYTHFETTASDAAPNYVDGDHNMNMYWLAFNLPGTTPFPNLGFSYSVLGLPNSGVGAPIVTFNTDDEDSGNANYTSFVAGSGTLIDGDYFFYSTSGKIRGTRFRISKVQ